MDVSNVVSLCQLSISFLVLLHFTRRPPSHFTLSHFCLLSSGFMLVSLS